MGVVEDGVLVSTETEATIFHLDTPPPRGISTSNRDRDNNSPDIYNTNYNEVVVDHATDPQEQP